MAFYDLPTYLLATNVFNLGRNLTSQNDQANGPVKKNHPNHNEHVEIDLSKMTKWFFLRLFKLGNFLLDLLVKKYHVF
jgi:hypothetical protein